MRGRPAPTAGPVKKEAAFVESVVPEPIRRPIGASMPQAEAQIKAQNAGDQDWMNIDKGFPFGRAPSIAAPVTSASSISVRRWLRLRARGPLS
jgi:hypothetical protein